MIFLSGPHSNSHEDCSYMSCHGVLFEVYIKLSHFSLHGSGKRVVFVFNDLESEVGRKIENISLESCSQILEETRRIQHPIQLAGTKQNIKDN